LTLLCELIKIY